MSKVTKKWIDRLLRDSNSIKRELELFLLENGASCSFDKLSIVSSFSNDIYEYDILNKIENRDYLFKKRCVEVVEEFWDSLSFFEREIFILRYRFNFSIDRICRTVFYERTSVYNVLALKNRLYDDIKCVEREVYFKDA